MSADEQSKQQLKASGDAQVSNCCSSTPIVLQEMTAHMVNNETTIRPLEMANDHEMKKSAELTATTTRRKRREQMGRCNFIIRDCMFM